MCSSQIKPGLLARSISYVDRLLVGPIPRGPGLLHFDSRTILFTRRSPPGRTNTTWPWPAPFRLFHDHVAIASWVDQYYVARSLGTRLQKARPRNLSVTNIYTYKRELTTLHD